MRGGPAVALATIELRLFLREPLTVLFTLAFPLVVLFVLSEVFGNMPDTPDDGVVAFLGVGPIDYYVPAYVVLVIASAGFISLPSHLAAYRERGVLRRFRASGASGPAVVGAQLAVAAVVVAGSGTVLVLAALAAYGTGLPHDPLRTTPALVLVVLEFGAIGVLLGVLLPSARAAQGVGLAMFFGMFMIAGAGPPPEVLSPTLRTISEALPLTHAIRAVQDPWLGRPWDAVDIAVCGALLVAAAGGAVLRLARD
jgi:ABC-2 type transport system permease protein